MKDETYKKISEFKRRLTEIITNGRFEEDKCHELFFKQDDLSPKYRVTIEMVNEKFFIDSLGRKWVRAENE